MKKLGLPAGTAGSPFGRLVGHEGDTQTAIPDETATTSLPIEITQTADWSEEPIHAQLNTYAGIPYLILAYALSFIYQRVSW